MNDSFNDCEAVLSINKTCFESIYFTYFTQCTVNSYLIFEQIFVNFAKTWSIFKNNVIGSTTMDREGSPSFIYPGLLVKTFAKFFKFSTFLKSKKAPIKYLILTLFDFPGSRDLLSAATIVENSKNVKCIIVAYRSFLYLNFRKINPVTIRIAWFICGLRKCLFC